jgi:predicted RNase H-like HicB family nuclease
MSDEKHGQAIPTVEGTEPRLNIGDRVGARGRVGIYGGPHPMFGGALVRFDGDQRQSLLPNDEVQRVAGGQSSKQRPSHIVAFQTDEDGDVLACVLEFPGCMTHGATQTEALSRLAEVRSTWVSMAREVGCEVPAPFDLVDVQNLIEKHRKAGCADAAAQEHALPLPSASAEEEMIESADAAAERQGDEK